MANDDKPSLKEIRWESHGEKGVTVSWSSGRNVRAVIPGAQKAFPSHGIKGGPANIPGQFVVGKTGKGSESKLYFRSSREGFDLGTYETPREAQEAAQRWADAAWPIAGSVERFQQNPRKKNPRAKTYSDYPPGTLVAQTSKFRKSIGSVTRGPVDGVVLGSRGDRVLVAWSEGYTGQIHKGNIRSTKKQLPPGQVQSLVAAEISRLRETMAHSFDPEEVELVKGEYGIVSNPRRANRRKTKKKAPKKNPKRVTSVRSLVSRALK